MEFNPKSLIFIDETGSSHRDTILKYGYGLQGMTPHTNLTYTENGYQLLEYLLIVELRMFISLRDMLILTYFYLHTIMFTSNITSI